MDSLSLHGILPQAGSGSEGDNLPIGTILMFAGSAISDEHWMLCTGTILDSADYPELFSVIGTTFGGTDVATQFRLPDYSDRFPIGPSPSKALGSVGGSFSHVQTIDELAQHTHIQDSHNHTQNSHNHTQNAHTHVQDAHTHTQNSHNHTQNSHNHSQNSHYHYASLGTGSGGAHTHTFQGFIQTQASPSTQYLTVSRLRVNGDPSDTPPSMNSSGSHSHTAAGNTNGSTATNIATTASNNAATATNQNTTAKNRDTTATNVAATATNIATTAVNQDTGSSIAMDITNPYQVINFIIKVK